MHGAGCFIFLAGLHRSGTSLLHEILRSHPDISGFSGTGVPEDEGQHLQTIYPPAKDFGGAGRFALDPRSHMDEHHPLATEENARRLFAQWCPHYDLSRPLLVEKSPPNIVRTRFLQRLFPGSRFVVILRHPLAVAYATRKWRRLTPVGRLVRHNLLAYERFLEDMSYLEQVHVLRYEEFVLDPQGMLDGICRFLGVDPMPLRQEVRRDVNHRYFAMWDRDRRRLPGRLLLRFGPSLEARANRFGYSLLDPHRLLPVPWLAPMPGVAG